MRDRLDELGDNTDAVLVTFTDHENLTAYAEHHQLGFPVLLDPDRTAYRAFGLGRGSIARIYGWKAARRYLQIFRADGFGRIGAFGRRSEDTLQLGGDFVVSPTGELAYGFWGDGPDDRPDVDELVEAVRAIEAGPSSKGRSSS